MEDILYILFVLHIFTFCTTYYVFLCHLSVSLTVQNNAKSNSLYMNMYFAKTVSDSTKSSLFTLREWEVTVGAAQVLHTLFITWDERKAQRRPVWNRWHCASRNGASGMSDWAGHYGIDGGKWASIATAHVCTLNWMTALPEVLSSSKGIQKKCPNVIARIFITIFLLGIIRAQVSGTPWHGWGLIGTGTFQTSCDASFSHIHLHI